MSLFMFMGCTPDVSRLSKLGMAPGLDEDSKVIGNGVEHGIKEEVQNSKEELIAEFEKDSKVYQIIEKKYKASAAFDKQILLNPGTDVIYPGSVILASSIENGAYTEVTNGGEKNPIKISYDLTGSTEAIVSGEFVPTLSGFRELHNQIVSQDGLNASGSWSIDTEFSSSEKQSEFKLKAGARFRGPKVKVKISSDFSKLKNVKRQQAIIRFMQTYYTVDVDQGVGTFLYKNVNLDSFGGYRPVYVSSLSYGRMAYAVSTTDREFSNFELSVKGAFKFLTGNATVESEQAYQELNEHATTNITVIGDDTVFTSLDGFKEFAENGGFSKESTGSIVAYKLRFVDNNEVAATIFNDEYVSREVKLIGDVVDEDNTTPVNFQSLDLEGVVRDAIYKQEGQIYVGDLLQLTELDASNKNIFGLEGIQYIKNLRKLDLWNNRIEDIGPIKGLKKLEELNLGNYNIDDGNQIENIIPLIGLNNLRILHMGNSGTKNGNQITNLKPLSGLTELEVLGVFNNQVRDIEPLEGLENLRILNINNVNVINGNRIADIEPLEDLINLTELYIGNVSTKNGNQIEGIEPLENLVSLTKLDLSGNLFENIEPLKELTGLTILNLSSNKIKDVTPLEGLVELKKLYLNNSGVQEGNQISDITPLANLTKLTKLHLFNDENTVSGNEIKDIEPVEDLIKLVDLDINRNGMTIDFDEPNTNANVVKGHIDNGCDVKYQEGNTVIGNP